MKKIIVTGAAGFVGSALIRCLLSESYNVLAIDVSDDPSSRLPLGNPLLKYVKCDLNNQELLSTSLKNFNGDTLFHFAWLGSAGPLRESPATQIANATLTLSLMTLANELGCKRFVCAGSIMEYETISAIYTQNTKPQKSYIYGIGKQLAHGLCKTTANSIGTDLIWAYITNAFGVGENSPRLINSTIKKIINHESLEFTSGTQNYDFLYIDDVARAFLLLGEKGKANNGYVIGSGKAGPLRGFLERIVSVCGNDTAPHFGNIAFTGVDLPLDVFSIEPLTRDTGFVPSICFDDGIRKTYDWFLKMNKKD